MQFDLDLINSLTGGRLGEHDVPCPLCGPLRRATLNQRRRVLRIWHLDPGFASYHCARCGESGHTRDLSVRRLDQAALDFARAEIAEREHIAAGVRLDKARWLWSKHQPITGTIAERYLREARGYGGLVSSTLGFLPARGKHGPAMIAAFGLADEIEPGILAIAENQVRGVHITRIAPDGSGKAGGDADKIMIGCSTGYPIVLMPPNDLLGLIIAEGIEDTLSAHEATGLGAWAAGSASRLPGLVEMVPSYIECVTLMVDDDFDGRRHSAQLQDLLQRRGIEVRSVLLMEEERTAA